MGRLDGKAAIITGGARGIGASQVRKFVSEGAKVVFTDILIEDGQLLERELNWNAKFIQHDVTKLLDWERVIQETETLYGPVNVLVNNAGISIRNQIENMSEEDYRKVIEVNQVSIFLGMKTILPSMKRGKSGSIINLSSIYGLVGNETSVAYVASKFAVRGMTKTAALEFAKYNIRVNSVHPGSVKTALTNKVYKNQQELDERSKNIPLQRFGVTDEVSNMVLFLASDESSYTTGAEFVVDGGLLAK